MTAIAAIVAVCTMAGCRNGPNSAGDTNGVSTGGAAGQVMPSAADTIHHDTSASGSAAIAPVDSTRHGTKRRRP